MTAAAETILSNLLTLSEEDRLEIADRLQSSVYGAAEEAEDTELSEEMKATLDRRWEEIESGKVECRDAFEVLAELRAKYHV